MSKQVHFDISESVKNAMFTAKPWPGEIPPHIKAKFSPEYHSTIVGEGYYGKEKLAEDDHPFCLKPIPGLVSPFRDMPHLVVDTEARKPFYDASRELALRRIQKELAEEEVKIAEHRLEIADKLYYIERLQTADTIGYSSELEKQRRGLDIQITYCEIESEKLILKKLELRKAELQDKWQEIQHWNP